MNTKKIALVGVFSAVALAVMFIEFPIFPAATFLKYDPSDIVALLVAIPYGISSGFTVIVIKDILYYLIKSGDIVGILMNILAGFSFVFFAAKFWNKNKVLAGSSAIVITTLLMTGINAIVVPFYFKAPFSLYLKFLPWIVAFNLVKFGIDFIVAMPLIKYLDKVFRLD
ncbi:MAG: ECF transporter S component [Thermotogaceae bacterium]|nr:ECF transporter S component [Thermotogaceae bacterium]